MKFEDTGFLLSKNKYNENSVIADFFTENSVQPNFPKS